MTILQNEKREDDQNVLPMAITNGSPWAGTTASTGHAPRTTAQDIPHSTGKRTRMSLRVLCGALEALKREIWPA